VVNSGAMEGQAVPTLLLTTVVNIHPEYLNSLSVFSEVFDAQSLLFCVVISGQLFLFLFAIVSSLFPLLIIP
jgi:hypothetical protein